MPHELPTRKGFRSPEDIFEEAYLLARARMVETGQPSYVEMSGDRDGFSIVIRVSVLGRKVAGHGPDL